MAPARQRSGRSKRSRRRRGGPALQTCLLAGLAALVACSPGCNRERTNGLTALTDPEVQAARVRLQMVPGAFHVGVITPIASDEARGVLLAEDQIERAGGLTGAQGIRFVILDNADEPPGAFAAKVDGMRLAGIQTILTSGSDDTLDAFRQTSSTPGFTLHVGMTATAPALTSEPDPEDRLFRTAPSDVFQGRVLADVAVQRIASVTTSPPRAAVLFDRDSRYAQGIRDSFRAAFEDASRGGTVVREVGFDAATISSAVQAAFAPAGTSTPHLVVLASLAEPDPAAAVLGAWADLGAPRLGGAGPFLLPDAIVQRVLVQNLPPSVLSALDGVRGVGPARGLGTRFQRFADDYRARFGVWPGPFASNAYDACVLLALAHEAASQAGAVTSSRAIAQQLRGVAGDDGGDPEVGPGIASLSAGLAALRSGGGVDYQGAYAAIDLDAAGELTGEIAYTVFRLDAATGAFVEVQTIVLSVP